jgi:hypothetical protein
LLPPKKQKQKKRKTIKGPGMVVYTPIMPALDRISGRRIASWRASQGYIARLSQKKKDQRLI